MAKRIKIEIVTNPTANVNFVYRYQYMSFSDTIGTTIGSVICPIGLTREDTANNLYTRLSTFAYNSEVQLVQSFSITGNIIYIDWATNDVIFPDLISDFSGIAFYEIDSPFNTSVVTNTLTRSTHTLRFTPNATFDSVELELYNYKGLQTDIPTQPSYILSKQVLQIGQQVVSFNVNELIKSELINNIYNYMSGGLQPLEINNSCWSYYYATIYNNNIIETTKSGYLYNLYGYGYFQDLYNPQPTNVLVTNNFHTHFRGQDNRLYFTIVGLTSLVVNGVAVSIVGYNEMISNERIMSININDFDTTAQSVNCVFTYGAEVRTITYNVVEDCKYDVKNIVFINKFGVPQSMFFYKVSKTDMSVTNSEYRGINDNFGVYNSTEHLYKTINVNGKEKLTVNSDNLDEFDNENIKQLMLSEQIWCIENGVINPIKLNKDSIEWKKSVNDKLIQYTLIFDYAFDVINQVC